jgi:1-acyl-sn-glycerol-3-phosphate acyltransferase
VNEPNSNFFLRWLTYLFFIPLMALATAVFGCLSLLCSLWDRSGRQQHAIARLWARILLWISLSPVKVIHPENLRQPGAAVYICNHLSYMDVPVLFSRLPFQLRILARHDLWKIPFVGWHLNRSGQIPVDSSNIRSSVASLNRGVAALQAGMPLVVFPDGGRSPDGRVRPFIAGAAWMAIRAGVPIVPLTLVGTHELLPMHVYHLTPRPLLLVAGEPISTEGCTTRDAAALTQRVFETVSSMYHQYSDHDAAHRHPDTEQHRV